MSPLLSGVYAPIGTPFVNEEVAYDQLAGNMEKYAASKLSGYLAIGSNGECVSLSEQEKDKVLETIVASKAPHQKVLAGANAESTKLTIDQCKRVADLGADFASVLTPCYFKKKLTDQAMTRYYLDVADGSPIPVACYNAPGFTGMTISTATLKAIASHGNIIGIKDTSPGMIGSYLRATEGLDFDVFSGTANTLFPAMMMGATGGIISLANVFPDVCATLYDRCIADDLAGARELHLVIGNLNSAVSGSYGVAGVKYASEVAGFRGGEPRLPLLPLQDSDKESIRRAIEATDFSTYI
ncbi:MAG: dihydrodipicolinate synthase family protein [Desulfofustis sp.]|nr:dihydrodipicolinate synthase family protein [Desulfofustis sp.]